MSLAAKALEEPLGPFGADSVVSTSGDPAPEADGEASISREESEKAQRIGLRGGPSSPEATAWIAALLDGVVLPAGKIADRPSSHRAALKALGALMADLLDLQRGRKRGGPAVCGSRGMARRDYPAEELGFGYNIFTSVLQALADGGYVTVVQGLPYWHTFTNERTGAGVISTKGRVTRFQLTRRAVEAAESFGVGLADWERHWGQKAPTAVRVASERLHRQHLPRAGTEQL